MRTSTELVRGVILACWLCVAGILEAKVTAATAARAITGWMTVAGTGAGLLFELRTDSQTYLDGLTVDTLGGVGVIAAAEIAEDGTLLRFESESPTYRSHFDLEHGVAVNPFGTGLQLGLDEVQQAASPPSGPSPR